VTTWPNQTHFPRVPTQVTSYWPTSCIQWNLTSALDGLRVGLDSSRDIMRDISPKMAAWGEKLGLFSPCFAVFIRPCM
jgi:hypothetical protein